MLCTGEHFYINNTLNVILNGMDNLVGLDVLLILNTVYSVYGLANSRKINEESVFFM